MNIFLVFLGGLSGFFVFDLYRIYSNSTRDGRTQVTFRQLKAVLAHSVIYVAAGLLGVFVNLDVLLSGAAASSTADGGSHNLLAGAMLRSFSLGALGPAGLAKTHAHARLPDRTISATETVDDTPVTEATFLDYVRYFLMR